MSDLQPTRNTIVFLTIVVEGGLVLLALGIGWLLDHDPFAGCTWNWSGLLWGLAAAVPMILAFLLTYHVPFGPLKDLKRFGEDMVRPVFSTCGIIDLVGLSCLAGLGEEVFFRGLLQDWLAGQTNVWLALALSAIGFGVLHAMTRTYAVLATLGGFYLGGVYLWTENLFAAITAHAAYDLFALLYLHLAGADNPG